MIEPAIHRFEEDGRRFAIDPETCFCFECDAISWDVLAHYPHVPVNRICYLLKDRHDPVEVQEVVGELEWLRATQAILKGEKLQDLAKQLEVERGLKLLTVRLPRHMTEAVGKKGWFGKGATVVSSTARDLGRDAVNLLLNRSEQQKDLRLEFQEPGAIHNMDLIAELCLYALKQARLAGKTLTAAVHVADLEIRDVPPALDGHVVGVKLEFRDPAHVKDRLRLLARGEATLGRLAKAVKPSAEGVTGRVIVRPSHTGFGDVVPALVDAGFSTIELDIDGAYVANPMLDHHEMVEALNKTAVYYAERLLEHRYFRLDPIAPLFYRIYDGSPIRRADPAGTGELAIDSDGTVYPSARLFGTAEHRLGSVAEGALDEEKRATYDALGAQTTGVCRRCWARSLCGGGCAAVHQALSGSFRRPQDAWCEGQRTWMASAVAAFNLLSSQGVNFTRVYGALSPSARPSLFTLVRAAFRMAIGMRPIEEADADMLCDWENWNEAAYFLCNESGVLLATKYDRQMDALHPQGIVHEMILVRKNGDPIGLVKIRPEPMPGTAQAWIYLHSEDDYAADEVRRGFRALLKEAGGQQAIRRLTVPVSIPEKGLQGFLDAVGFKREGTLREALFLHGEYRDVYLYGLALDEL